MRLWCGAFFRKSGTLAAEVSQNFFPCDTSSTRVVFLRQSAPHGRPSHTFVIFRLLAAARAVLKENRRSRCRGVVADFFFSTPLRRECRFGAKTRRTAATASVLEPKKPSPSLQSGAFWAKKGALAAEVLSSIFLFSTPLQRECLFLCKTIVAAAWAAFLYLTKAACLPTPEANNFIFF